MLKHYTDKYGDTHFVDVSVNDAVDVLMEDYRRRHSTPAPPKKRNIFQKIFVIFMFLVGLACGAVVAALASVPVVLISALMNGSYLTENIIILIIGIIAAIPNCFWLTTWALDKTK